MPNGATLKVISGPDRGKVFQLSESLVHMGRGADNQIAITDPEVSDHQASIVEQNGRYAIYTPIEQGVEVDGNLIPIDRWIWLSGNSRIRLTGNTSFQFQAESSPEAAATPNAASRKAGTAAGEIAQPARPRRKRPPEKGGEPTEAAPQKPGERPERGERKGGAQRKVAKFITTQQGEALVRLGEDGHLPELSLDEAKASKNAAGREAQQRNPALIYLAVGMSFFMSLAMIAFDFDSTASATTGRNSARQELRSFEGKEGEPLKDYQRLIREAQRANSRGDRKEERRAYREVFERLNSEDVLKSINGLTGSKSQDERLKELVSQLLGS